VDARTGGQIFRVPDHNGRYLAASKNERLSEISAATVVGAIWLWPQAADAAQGLGIDRVDDSELLGRAFSTA
jgi:hypothetical protein